MVFDTLEEIKEVIDNPKNSGDLDIAKRIENELKLYTEDIGRDLIFSVVRERMTDDHYKTFVREFKNPIVSIYSTISDHLAKVYDAHGAVFTCNFNTNIEREAEFKVVRKDCYGISDTRYWRTYGHESIIKEPNSVFLTSFDPIERKYLVKKIPLVMIHDVYTEVNGIQYIIFKSKRKESYIFYVYDSKYYYKLDEKGVLLEKREHGAQKCPVVWCSNNCLYSNSYNVRKSVLSDKVIDGTLRELLINTVAMRYYKARSAYDTIVRPESEEDVRQKELWDRQARDEMHELTEQMAIKNARQMHSNNPEHMGQKIIIPNAKLANTEFVNAIISATVNISANTDLLKYHDDYLEREEIKIVNRIIGSGLGSAVQNRAVNQDQVSANFDEQERKLKSFGENVEQTWTYSLWLIASILQGDSDFDVSIKLGERYFLKTEDLLLSELEQLHSGTSNRAAIEQKQKEIYLTRNRHNPKAVERYDLIQLLQPLAALPQSYISRHRDSINNSVISSYENFPQVLAIFELEHGAIENFMPDTQKKLIRFKKIKDILKRIETEQYGTANTTKEENNH